MPVPCLHFLSSYGPYSSDVMVHQDIGYAIRTPLVRVSSNLNSQLYTSQILRLMSYLRSLADTIFLQDNAQELMVPAMPSPNLKKERMFDLIVEPGQHVLQIFHPLKISGMG
ncbi:hypothetical protein TNCV_883931 [Trichonephila clavipes]|nr:hypothetical protein TNCV_883931 [Trichonephila clavipes]